MVNLPGNLAPGTWYIGALADYENQIGESVETNNNGNLLTITVPRPSLTDGDTQLIQAMANSFAEAAGSLTALYGPTTGEGLPVMLAEPGHA